MRLFIAAEVPAAVRRSLGRWAREAAGDDGALRLVDVEAMHLTLAFLGHRGEQEVPALAAAVGAACSPAARALPLAVGSPLWLAPRRPHVLTVGIEDEGGGLAEVHEALWSLLETLGFSRERRRFRPHVTVARVRHGARVSPRELPPPPPDAFCVDAVTLFRSHLGGGRPARYEALERVVVGS